MNNTPIDEYYFWKNFIETRQENGMPVPDEMFVFLKDIEIRILKFLMDKHHSHELVTSTNHWH